MQEKLLMVLPRLVKKTIGNKMFYGEGENGTHTLDGGHVQMANDDPEAQTKSSLSDCTWLQ